MADGAANGNQARNPDVYASFTRFELELEFVQLLSNPQYLNHLAEKKYFDDENFIRYLAYLQYFQQREYVKYLQYPGPTLKALEMLQQERFREDILNPQVVRMLQDEWFHAATTGSSG